jgi:alpha-L-arabinofuranosidase
MRKVRPRFDLLFFSFRVATHDLLQDQHFYVAPPFFLEHFGTYDMAVRTDAAGRPAPRVYVGEFAVNNGVGSGNLTAALSEAVFMMGMEKNSDLVTMCSYAPLLFNVNRRDWPVNMIGYDSAVSFGRTSYWGQRLFANNMPDVNLATEVASPLPLAMAAKSGMIGVGTWNSQAEFKDINVVDPSGKVLFAFDAEKPNAGLKPVSGEWRMIDGALRQIGNQQPTRAVAGDRNWREYSLALKARKLSGEEGFLIMFTTGQRDKCWWNLGGWGNQQHGLELGGGAICVPGTIEPNRWYDIRIELSGNTVQCFLDGRLVQQADRSYSVPSLYAIAGQKKDTAEIIVKIVNAANEPQPTEIKLTGITKLAPKATVFTLSHPDRGAENTVDSPAKIVPTRSVVNIALPGFTDIVPANSISVLCLGGNAPKEELHDP